MKNLIGLLIILAGILLLGNYLDWWNINIFFEGWWSLFIIIPGIISFIQRKFLSGILSLLIGFFLLLAAQEIISWQAVGPIFIISIGLLIIFSRKNSVNKKSQKEYLAIFSGNENVIEGDFNSSNLTALFGGIDLDLRNAKIADESIITINCIFGGIEILVPDDINVVVNCTPIFGGLENKTKSKGKKTITINALCVFGGIEIK